MARSDKDRELTRPFGNWYADFNKKTRERLQALSDESLLETKAAIRRLTERNCWWAEYQAQEHVYEEIIYEERRRERERREPDNG